MKKRLIFLLFLFTLYGCPIYDPPFSYLEVRNYSDQPIYVYLSHDDTLPQTPGLSLFYTSNDKEFDAWGNEMPSPTIHAPEYRIDAYGYGKFYQEGEMPNRNTPDRRFYIFFIKEETMRNYSWHEIWENQIYEKRDSVTEGEMKKTLWKYTYFPTHE